VANFADTLILQIFQLFADITAEISDIQFNIADNPAKIADILAFC
jgi:hypothetical protein